MFDIMKMMGQLGKIKEVSEAMQKNLEAKVIEAEVGAGAVKVLGNAKKDIRKIIIDPEFAKPEQIEALQTLLVAACGEFNRKADDAAKEALAEQTKDLLPNMPPGVLEMLMKK